jgi:small multidrug resistance family-3 protein
MILKALQHVNPLFILILATLFEAAGDALVRSGLYHHAGLIRLGLLLTGAALLFGYGTLLNLAPLEFGRVIGLYIATLFVVWQAINFVAFRSLPTLSTVVGGAFIIAGGAIVTYWKAG